MRIEPHAADLRRPFRSLMESRLRGMFDRLYRSIFGGETSSRATAPEKAALDRASFVAFIVDVDEISFVGPDETLDSDQASMRLRVGIPARELARRIPVCLVPIDYVAKDPTLAALGTVRGIVVGKAPVRFFVQERERARALVSWVEATARRNRILVDFADDLAAAGRSRQLGPRQITQSSRRSHSCREVRNGVSHTLVSRARELCLGRGRPCVGRAVGTRPS